MPALGPEELPPSSELLALPGHLVRRLQQIAVSVFVSKLEASGFDLTPVQYAALTAVRDNPGLDQLRLAGLIAYDRTTMGGVVDRLLSKGYLRREIADHDRRARAIFLTSSGEKTLAAVRPLVLEVQNDILVGLSAPERRVFVDLLRKATDAGNALSRAPMRAVDR